MHARLKGVRVYELGDFYEYAWGKVPIYNLRDRWFAHAEGFDLIHQDIALKTKRVIDILLSVALIILVVPLFLFVSIIVKLTSKGPVLYRQVREGAKGEEFILYKFRTMIDNAEAKGAKWAKKDDPRVTKVGKYIRLVRIDEIPQLWNVLKGNMSFIGPRPERPEFNRKLEKKIPYYDLRNLVKPGITGWAQVMYPYGSSVDDAKEKLEYDLYYIKNYSLLLDFMILMKTMRVVLFGRGR